MPQGPKVNLASSSEHVPEIERRIRVVKERSRSIRHSLPYNKIPVLLTIWIVFNAVRLLNHFPVKGGISDTISPKTIMTGETLNYKKHLGLQVGQYCQVHEDDLPRNSQLPRTQGAIVLGPSGNVQGGFKFMSLKTEKKITRRSWDIIPITDTVVNRVNEIGKEQPELFVFTNRKGQLIGDVEIPGVDEIPESHDPAGVDGDNQTPQYDFDDKTNTIEIKDDLEEAEAAQPQQKIEPASQPDVIDVDQEPQADAGTRADTATNPGTTGYPRSAQVNKNQGSNDETMFLA